MGENADQQALAKSHFVGFRENPPRSWDQSVVAKFHSILGALDDAYDADFSSFRIRSDEMKPRGLGPRRRNAWRYEAPAQKFRDSCCPIQTALQRVESAWSYFQTLEARGAEHRDGLNADLHHGVAHANQEIARSTMSIGRKAIPDPDFWRRTEPRFRRLQPRPPQPGEVAHDSHNGLYAHWNPKSVSGKPWYLSNDSDADQVSVD